MVQMQFTKRCGHGVRAAKRLLQAHPAHQRRHHHLPAGGAVSAIIHSTGKPFCSAAYRVQPDGGGRRVVPDAATGLDTMAQRVDTCRRCQARWQGQRQIRIADHKIGNHVQIHGNYLAAVKKAHHTGAAHLGAGAGSGRDCNLR